MDEIEIKLSQIAAEVSLPLENPRPEFSFCIFMAASGARQMAATRGSFTVNFKSFYTHLFSFGDPLVSATGARSAELAAVFFTISILMVVGGPGRFSLDKKIFG
jgi:hypothetical protein